MTDEQKVWKQERPAWCPHTDCEHKRRAMDNACVGALPEPAPHDGDFNHYRICMNGVLPNGEVFDLRVNNSDLYWLRWLYSALHEDPELVRTKVQLDAARAECEAVRAALGAYPDSNLESLAKLYRDVYIFRTARCDSGDCETLEMYRRRIPIRIERSPVCLGCGKTYADCKCTDEQIEYHKRLEREQKAE